MSSGRSISQVFRPGLPRRSSRSSSRGCSSPHDYGIAAMVLVFSAVVPIFSDLALGAALVQRRRPDRGGPLDRLLDERRPSGSRFTLLGIAGVVADRRVLRRARGAAALRGALAQFLVTALGTTQKRAPHARDELPPASSCVMMAGTLVGGIGGIALAVAGYGAWAIIGQQLAIAAVVDDGAPVVFSPWRRASRSRCASLRGCSAASAPTSSARASSST